MVKVKEAMESGRYQYVASSMGNADPRFNLSVFLEPSSDCHFGNSTKEITRCFLERSDSQPGLVEASRKTLCFDTYCAVYYGIETRIGERPIKQMHANLIFAYRDGWAHVHLSILAPTDDDLPALNRFSTSLTFAE